MSGRVNDDEVPEFRPVGRKRQFPSTETEDRKGVWWGTLSWGLRRTPGRRDVDHQRSEPPDRNRIRTLPPLERS